MQECQSGFIEFCNDIESYLQRDGEVIAKKRNFIKIITFKDKRYVVKRFKTPNLINRFAYRFIRDSKAKRSYQNANRLLNLGIFNPNPIGYIEEFNPLLNRSYYISEYFDFDFEIREVLTDENFKDRENILIEFVKFSYTLHQKGICHIDYSPGNVLIRKEGSFYKFALVDLNRMKFIKFDDDLRFKNLSRFSATQKDTIFIAKEYAKVSGIDENFSIETLKKYHDEHQRYISNKKRLKGKKVVDS